MNRDKARKLKPIFDAFCEGKPIEYQAGNGRWEETNILEIEGFPVERYRVKPDVEKVLPYRRYVYRSHSGALGVGTSWAPHTINETSDSFVEWIDLEDQLHEIPVEKVKAQETKANQDKGGKK